MRCVFGGGGTGGHLYPALAIAEKIVKEEPDSKILFIGSKDRIESEIVPKMGYDFISVPTSPMSSGDGFLKKVSLGANTGLSNFAGVAKSLSIIKKFKPDAVIGTGGYVCLPVVLAGQIAGIPTYVHEQNAVPGRANKVLSKRCKKLFVGFKGTEDAFGYPEKTIFTGNPVRAEFQFLDKDASREKLGIPKNDFVVFAFGGSLGSATINEISLAYLERIKDKSDRTLLIGTGRRFHEECIDRCNAKGLPTEGKVRFEGYIDNMKDYVAASDVLICRAGALSLAELMVAGKPAIIVPIPNSVGNHQYYNARTVADAGAAFLVDERDMDLDDICEKIEYLASSPSTVQKMGEICASMAKVDAADIIYREILSGNA